jgi:hypothetical protein
LVSIKSAMSGIESQSKSLNTLKTILPNYDSLSGVSKIMDLSRNVMLSYSGLSSVETIKNLAVAVSINYQPWYDETIGKNLKLINQSFLNPYLVKANQSIKESINLQNLSTFSIQSSLAKATELSLFAEKSLSTFKWKDVGQIIRISDSVKGLISNSFLDLAKDYSGLLKSFSDRPTSFIELGPTLTKTIPIEYYSGANFLEVISVNEDINISEELIKNEIQYENEYSLNLYLPEIDSGFIKMWKGAIETYNSKNSDRVRQFSVSIRELFTHLMHRLAPDEEIKKWTSESSFYFEGKPTRKARLYYICRNISNNSFNKFVEKDIQATLEFINIFQEGTHSIESSYTPQQLIAIKSKAETTLKFLLEIEFSVNR